MCSKKKNAQQLGGFMREMSMKPRRMISVDHVDVCTMTLLLRPQAFDAPKPPRLGARESWEGFDSGDGRPGRIMPSCNMAENASLWPRG